MKLLNTLLYKILELQEKFLRFRLSKTLGVKNNSKRKKHFVSGCTLDLNSIADIEKQHLEDELSNILKVYEYILEFLHTHKNIKYRKDYLKILENFAIKIPITLVPL